MTAAEKFQRLLKADSRYDAEAYNFVYEALDYTLKHVLKGKKRSSQHVCGRELLEGVRLFALEQFGCLARSVFESWGVRVTDDFGQIVFNLVEYDLMGKQESDRREDFSNVYDFREAFDVTPYFHYSGDREEWTVSYIPRSQASPRKSRVES
ncbi:MAG: hypothetical protein JXA90_01970 [Planctomycetes bacterium]|nr:hypothetical protein [Planctomycetota bacterium]